MRDHELVHGLRDVMFHVAAVHAAGTATASCAGVDVEIDLDHLLC